MAEPSQVMLGAGAAFMSSVTWAIGSTVYAIISKTENPARVNFSRAAFAFPIFFGISILTAVTSGENPFAFIAGVDSSKAFWLLMSMFSGYAFGDVLFFLSATMIGIPAASAIAATYPLWASLAGWLFHGQVLSELNWYGLIFIVLGTVIVVSMTTEASDHKKHEHLTPGQRRRWLGVILGLITSLFWALNSYSVARGSEGLTPSTVNFVRMGIALILCPLVALIQTRQWHFFVSKPHMKKYWPVFVLESVAGSIFFTYGLQHSPLFIGAALSSLSPVIVLPFALALKMEKFSFRKSSAIVMVVVGIWLLVA